MIGALPGLLTALTALLPRAATATTTTTFGAPVLVCENCSWPDTYAVVRPHESADSAALMGFAHGTNDIMLCVTAS